MPTVEKSAPRKPFTLYPTKVAAFIAMGPGVASAMACIDPMTATIISVLFLDEELTGFSILGIIFILASVVLLSREGENN